jgi:MFS family permease
MDAATGRDKVATATKARLTVLIFTFALSVIAYIDRVCISSAAPDIRRELHLSASQMGWVFSAFTFAYAAFEIPSGWLGDRIGPQKVLTRIVLWWSVFTVATGFAWNYATLLAIRFLFGIGEAGAYPNAAKSISSWFPAAERGRAHGALFMGARLGAALTPPLVVLLIAALGWRHTFWVFGILGAIWAIFWWRWYRDDPAAHPAVNQAELSIIRGGDAKPTEQGKTEAHWGQLFQSRNLLFIGLHYFCYGYGLYFYLTWLPTYLREARGFSARQTGWIAGAILLVAAAANVIGGILTDRLSRHYGLKVGRCYLGASALGASAFVIAAAALVTDPVLAAVLVGLAAGISELSIGAGWAVCLDVGREQTGIVTGYMNTFGNLGGAIGPLAMGYAVEWWGSWQIPFATASVFYLLGALFWLLIDPLKKVIVAEVAAARP